MRAAWWYAVWWPFTFAVFVQKIIANTWTLRRLAGYIIQFEPIRLLESHSNPKLIYRSHPVFSIKNVVQPTKKAICIGGIRSVEGFASFTNEFIPYGASLTDFSKNLCKTMLKVIYVCI